jgi:hypothetical protein
MRRAVVTLAAGAVVLASSGCALDPYATRSPNPLPATTHANAAASTRARAGPAFPAASTALALPAAGDKGPAAVLYRFAQTYGDVSPHTVAGQLRALSRLAVGALAAQLNASERTARLQAIRAMPDGARLQSTIASLQLAPRAGARQRGVVILEQQLVTAGRTVGVPVTTVFLAGMLKTGAGWRVATFTAEH